MVNLYLIVFELFHVLIWPTFEKSPSPVYIPNQLSYSAELLR